MCRIVMPGFRVCPTHKIFGRILGRDAMKNPLEVLRTKEQELTKVKKEVEALRITVHLLGENNQSDEAMNLRQVIEMP